MLQKTLLIEEVRELVRITGLLCRNNKQLLNEIHRTVVRVLQLEVLCQMSQSNMHLWLCHSVTCEWKNKDFGLSS